MCFLLLTSEINQLQFTSLLKKNRKSLKVKFQFHQPSVFPNSPLLRLHVNSEVQKPTDVCVLHCRQLSQRISQETEVCDWWISILFVSLFVGSLLVIVIMLTAAKNAIAKTAFELQCSGVFEKRSNQNPKLPFNRN